MVSKRLLVTTRRLRSVRHNRAAMMQFRDRTLYSSIPIYAMALPDFGEGEIIDQICAECQCGDAICCQ